MTNARVIKYIITIHIIILCNVYNILSETYLNKFKKKKLYHFLTLTDLVFDYILLFYTYLMHADSKYEHLQYYHIVGRH